MLKENMLHLSTWVYAVYRSKGESHGCFSVQTLTYLLAVVLLAEILLPPSLAVQ